MPITSKPVAPCTEQWKVYDQAVANSPAKPAHIAKAEVDAAQDAVDRCYREAATYTPINDAITTEVIAASVDRNTKKVRFAVWFSGTIERPGQPTVELDNALHSFTVSLSEVEDDEEDDETGDADPVQPRLEGAHHTRTDWA